MDEAEREEKEEEEQDKIDMFSLMEELKVSIETQVHCVVRTIIFGEGLL